MTSDSDLSEPPQLVAALLLEAGRVMEDTSFDLALTLPANREAIDQLLALARQAGSDIVQLVAAAEVLQRRSSGE